MRITFTVFLVAATAVALGSNAFAQPHVLGGDVPADDVHIPPPLDLPYPQIVDPARYVPTSISHGTTSTGRLLNAAHLPDDGLHHFVLPHHLSRDTHYGTTEIVTLIMEAAEEVFARTGVRVGVGNIANPQGGDLYWSRSHNNGRDADLAFFFVDETGASVEPETLLTVRRNGLARDGSGRRFDVATSWALVEALLRSETTQIQWIFIYDPLKQMLLEHAREIGADETLISLASDILHQPGDSAPHDDHFHIRIFCSRSDRLEGCTNWGPEWDHAHLWNDEVEARVEELARGLSDPDGDVGARCLGRINELAGASAVPQIAAALPHASPDVQVAIMEVLAEHDQPGVAGSVVPLLESSPFDDVRQQAAWLLGYLADPTSAAPLAALVRHGGARLNADLTVEEAAAHALRNVWSAASLPDLVAASDHPDESARLAISHVLLRVTGAAPPTPTPTGWWHAWYAQHGASTQDEWYRQAFVDAGYLAATAPTAWADVSFEVLVSALRDERDAIRFIADRALLQRTDGWTPSEGWTVTQRWRYWAGRLGFR